MQRNPVDRDPEVPEALDTREPTLSWVLARLLRERRTLFVCTGIGAVLGLLVALLRPATYTTSFSFTSQSSDRAAGGSLASLAGQFGLSLGSLTGDSRPPEFYADLVNTREILVPLVTGAPYQVALDDSSRVALPEFLDETDHDTGVTVDQTIEHLRQKVLKADVASRTTGVITVQVSTRSPLVSAEIAERLLRGLNDFNLATAQRQAAAERQFLEGRLDASRQDLRHAEDALQGFLQQNRQVANSPELTFRMERLQREVDLQQQLVTGLAQQYEDARIREVRDTPVLAVVERPTAAARPDPRKRLLILFAGCSLGCLLGCTLVLGRDILTGLPEGGDRHAALLAAEVRNLRPPR